MPYSSPARPLIANIFYKLHSLLKSQTSHLWLEYLVKIQCEPPLLYPDGISRLTWCQLLKKKKVGSISQ